MAVRERPSGAPASATTPPPPANPHRNENRPAVERIDFDVTVRSIAAVRGGARVAPAHQQRPARRASAHRRPRRREGPRYLNPHASGVWSLLERGGLGYGIPPLCVRLGFAVQGSGLRVEG